MSYFVVVAVVQVLIVLNEKLAVLFFWIFFHAFFKVCQVISYAKIKQMILIYLTRTNNNENKAHIYS